MYDALETSGGKADMRLILIGTRAPAAEGNWWRSLVDHGDGSTSTYRQVHDAPVDDEGQPIDPLTMRAARRANPLIGWNPHLLPELRDQLHKARQSEDAFARWCSYRLNRPMQPARSVLFTVPAWRRIEGAARAGRARGARSAVSTSVRAGRGRRACCCGRTAALTSPWWRPESRTLTSKSGETECRRAPTGGSWTTAFCS